MPLSPIATADGFRKVTISPANITVEAELVGDTLTLVAGTNVTLNADSTSDAVTINCGTAYGDIFINAENTNASRYMVFVHGTSGAQSTYIDTDLTYNPGTNTLSAAYYSGDGGSLTNITAGNLAGTIPSVVLGNSTVFIGTTGILLNRTSASQTLNGVSIDGNAATATKSTNLVGGNNTTLLGSLPYQSNTDTTALLSPNTTSTKKYLTMTGTGVNGAAPSWETIAAGDVPTLNQNTSGTAAGLSGSQTANTFYAGPSTGGAATATFRALVNADIPGTLSSKRIDPRVSSSASAASVTPDVSLYDQICFTALAADLTINAPIGTLVDGTKLMFRLLDNGVSRLLNWDGTFTSIGVTLPTATTISKTTYVGCIYNSNNTRWDVIAVTTQV